MKFIATAFALAASASGAIANETSNGLQLNGFTLNSIASNVITFNGVSSNVITFNGSKPAKGDVLHALSVLAAEKL